MSEDIKEVVTGETEAVEPEVIETPAEPTLPPSESEESKGLRAAASAERHKRQAAERELEKLRSERLKAPIAAAPADDVRQIVAASLAEERELAKQAEANVQWDNRIEQAQKEHTDVNIAEIIQDETFYPYVSDAMADVIRNDPDGVSVMLHLNNNREQLHKLAQLPPIQAAQQMGRIAEQIKAGSVAKVSNAPDPIKPVGSRSVTTKDPDDMSPREYEAYIREQRGGSVWS